MLEAGTVGAVKTVQKMSAKLVSKRDRAGLVKAPHPALTG